MSCIQDGVEWVVVGRAAKGGSWAMWWFTVSSGGLKWWTQESETGGVRRVGQQQQQQHSRRKIGAGELWCTSLYAAEREKEGEKKRASAREEGKGQNFRRQKDEIRFYLLLGRTAILDGVGSPTVRSGTVQHRWSGIMNKLATCHREKDRPCTF